MGTDSPEPKFKMATAVMRRDLRGIAVEGLGLDFTLALLATAVAGLCGFMNFKPAAYLVSGPMLRQPVRIFSQSSP